MTTQYQCPCCGYYTLSASPPGTFEICPVCYWEDDNVQYYEPDYCCGANHESLNEACKNYKEFGASSKDFLQRVRKPFEQEKEDGA